MTIKYKKLKKRPFKDEKIKFNIGLAGKSETVVKKFKHDKKMNIVFTMLSMYSFFIGFGAAVGGITIIKFSPVWLLWMCKIILGILALFVSGIFAAWIAHFIPEYKRGVYESKSLVDARKNYCKRHKQYYGFPNNSDDYILTSCYKHFDDKFANRPICLYRKDNKLCITGDIVNGFINAARDIGMYEIDDNSIDNIERINFEGKNAYRVVANGKEMIFAWRAKYILFSDCYTLSAKV